MNRLLLVILFSLPSLTVAFADSCDTGNMTILQKCVNEYCTETETVEVSRNTPGEVSAILGGQKKTSDVEDQDLYIEDYCNNATFFGQNLHCTSLGITRTIKGWKQYGSNIYRVVNGNYYKYNNGMDLLNQKTSNSHWPNNPLGITVGNICTSWDCTSTREQNFSVFDSNTFIRYEGNLNSFTMEEYDRPVITSLYVDESKKTNSPFSYGAIFFDRVPQGCTNGKYIYNPKILTWNNGSLITEFTDSNTNGNPHVTTHKTGEIISGNITESISLGQTGYRKIEMNISDASGNKGTKTSGLMEVIQGDVNKEKSSIISYQNTTTSYYPGDTLIYKVILRDTSGNVIKDKPATFSHSTLNDDIVYLDSGPIYSDANSGEYILRINISRPLSFIENFTVTLPYWDDSGADINNGHPQVIHLGNSSRIAIRDPNLAASEFAISCSRGPITLKARCARDNLSGCNNSQDGTKTFLNEGDNSAVGGLLGSYDNAGNLKQYRYIMQHIDTTKPTGTLKLGNITLTNNISLLASDEHLSLSIDDVHPPGCGKTIAYTLSRPINIGNGTHSFAGNIQAGHILDFGTTNLTKQGAGRINYTLTDVAGNVTTNQRDVTIYPYHPSIIKSTVALAGTGVNSNYADNTATYTYKLTLRDQFENPIYGKTIASITQDGSKTIKTDMSNPSSPAGNDAITEEWINGVNTTNINGEVFFKLRSNTPGVFTERFKVSMHTTWDNNYQDIGGIQEIYIGGNTENSFKKTFIGGLSIITSPYKLLLGTTLTMKLSVDQKSSIPTYTIYDFSNDVIANDSVNHKISDASPISNPTFNPTVDYRIEARTNAGVNIVPGVSINGNPIISYTLNGNNIKYRLSATDNAYDNSNITIGGDKASGLKITGILQGQGKQSLAGQKVNFSDISKSDTRAIIRKNAYSLIRGMTNGQELSGVKYIEGDTALSGTPTYETLILKNGNITISSNFNTTGKKFGIIVLRDNATKVELGNIYIQPGVKYIQAAIYADGGIISTGFSNDTVGNYKDSTTRTNTLSGQLVINGSLFTRNTIGGAILGDSGKYILPGGSMTNDFNQAMMYDLSFLRRWNNGYNISGVNGTADYNKGNSDNVVIIANSNLQKDPPKGFKN